MRIIIDTNIVFSLLLSKNSVLRNVLFNKSYKFYSPNFVITEIFKYKEKILKYSKSNKLIIYEYFNKILERIHFINDEIISEKNRVFAYELCKDIDENDTPFIALSLEIDGLLWSGDKKLINHLNKKGFKNIFIKKENGENSA